MTMQHGQEKNSAIDNLVGEWQQWLRWFLSDLQGDFGKILHQLRPLLSAPRPSDEGGLLTAPGLETVKRRGDYANLLLSEWVLADSFPDEFLRRAAQHEHLFFSPPPLEEDGGKRVLALFDAGILQLGLPRIAHLALMILLSRRAQLLKGEFFWGIVQSEPQWLEFSNASHLRQMLNERRMISIDPEKLDKWRDFVAKGDKGDECWFITSQTFHDLGKSLFASHRLSIDETFNGSEVDISLRQTGRPPLNIALPLPDDKQCKRLLSAKFIAPEDGETQKNSRQKGNSLLANTSLLSPLIISPSGKKLMLRRRGEKDNSYIEVDIKSSNRPRIRNWSVPKGTTIIAAGYSQNDTICLILKFNNHYEYWSTDKVFPRGKIDFASDVSSLTSSQAIQQLIIMLDIKGNGSIARFSNASSTVLVTDAVGMPYREDSYHEYDALSDVLAVQYHSPMEFLYLSQDEGGFLLRLVHMDELETQWVHDLGPVQKLGDRFIFTGIAEGRLIGAPAKFVCGMLGQKQDKRSLEWFSRTFFEGAGDWVENIFTIPEGAKVIGTWFDEDLEFLVPIIWDHKKTIGAWRGDRFENWYSDKVKLARVEMCIYSGTIVMHNIDHDIIFFDVASKEVLHHMSNSGAHSAHHEADDKQGTDNE